MSYSIAIASGKGGAGKTSIAAALYAWLGTDAVLADCDVDAANAVIALEATRNWRRVRIPAANW